jgi:hypothetical protein
MYQDFGDEPVYPTHGTMEEKVEFSLEQVRNNFWWARKNWLNNRAGGRQHTALLQAYGPAMAERSAKHAEDHYKQFCETAMLTEEGESKDTRFPVDKMINTELRRIRGVIILSVSQYMHYFESMMPEETTTWDKHNLYFNLDPYRYRYAIDVWDQIDVVIPKKKLNSRSPADLEKFIEELSVKYGRQDTRVGFAKEFLISKIRDELIEFILQDLPFNNVKMEANTVTTPVDEPQEETKVLH